MTLSLGSLTFTRANYRFSEKDDQPNFDIKILKGCGNGSFPLVQQFRHVYTIRPYEFCCLGATIDAAMANRDALLTVIVNASDKTKPACYLVRTVTGQTTPDIWTVLGGVPHRVRQHWDGIYKVWCPVDLYVYPGQRIPAGL